MKTDGPIFYMPVCKKDISELIKENVRQDGLRYQFEFAGWSLAAGSKLRQYLCTRPLGWSLNDQSLNDLCKHFNNEYTSHTLRKKCFEYGIDYEYNWGNEASGEDIDMD